MSEILVYMKLLVYYGRNTEEITLTGYFIKVTVHDEEWLSEYQYTKICYRDSVVYLSYLNLLTRVLEFSGFKLLYNKIMWFSNNEKNICNHSRYKTSIYYFLSISLKPKAHCILS